MKKNILVLIIALALLVTGIFSLRAVETNWGQIRTETINLTTANSAKGVHALAYIPEAASPEHPVPVVITLHGGSQNISQQVPLSIEFSRRGYAVFAVDLSGAGESEPSNAEEIMDSVIAYIGTLNYLKQEIIITGHSMGGREAFTAGKKYPDIVKLVIANGMNTREDTLPTNYAYIIGRYDASGLNRCENHVITDIVNVDSYRKLFGTETDIVPGQEYGNWAEGTGRIYMLSNTGHTWEPFNSLQIRHNLDVSNRVIPQPDPIAFDNQVWIFAVLAQLMCLVGIFLFAFGLAATLLNGKFFGKLILPSRKPVGFRPGSPIWIGALAVMVILPPAMYCLLSSVMETHSVDWMLMNSTVDGIVHWHWALGVLYIGIFLAFHFLQGKKNGGNLMNYGLSTEPDRNAICITYILRAAAFAVCIFGSAYGLFTVFHQITGHNISMVKWNMGVLPDFKLSQFGIYLLLDLPYLLTVSLACRSLNVNNGSREKGKGMRNSVLLSLAISSIGLVVALGVFLITVATTGQVLFTADRGYIFFTGLSGTLPWLAICGLINCYVINRTNSGYAGVMTATLFSVWGLVAGFPMAAL